MAIPNSLNLKRSSGALPVGVYQLRIEKIEGKSGQNDDYWALQLRPLDGDQLIYSNLMMGKKSRWVVDSFLDAVKAPTEGSWPMAQFRGKTVWAKLKIAEYKGRLKNEVEMWLTPEQAEKAISTQGVQQEFEFPTLGENDAEELAPVQREEEEVEGDEFPA